MYGAQNWPSKPRWPKTGCGTRSLAGVCGSVSRESFQGEAGAISVENAGTDAADSFIGGKRRGGV